MERKSLGAGLVSGFFRPDGAWARKENRYPPLKRWAIFARPCRDFLAAQAVPLGRVFL